MEHELVIPAGEKKEIVIVHSSPESVKRVIRLAGDGAEVNVEEIFMSSNVQSNLT